MKKLIEDCGNPHNYVWLKREEVRIHEPLVKLVIKDMYACVDCGKGLEIYDLDNPRLVEEI